MSHHLFKAAADGNLQKVKDRLEQGDPVDYIHKGTGRTALSEAALNGHLEIVKMLIENGADINWLDSTLECPPLSFAIDGDHLSVVQFLIDSGADVNRVGEKMIASPLNTAIFKDNLEVVTLLLKQRADPTPVRAMDNKNSLSIAIERGNTKIIEALQLAGAKLPPAVVEPTAIPWSSYNPVDYSNPNSVLYAFINAMYQWADEAYKNYQELKSTEQEFDFTEHKQLHDEVITAYCTNKKRVYSAADSVGFPYGFDLDEVLLQVNTKTKTRVELITRMPLQDYRVRYEKQYVLLKKDDRWLMDSMKNRVIGHTKWRSAIL